MSLVDTMIEATQEVFTSMVSLSASAGVPFERTSTDADSLTGMVQFNGQWSGYTAINLPEATALLVTSSFLFMDADDITTEELKDSLGELANILAGSIKSFLDPGGSAIQLSVPMLLHGHEFTPERQPESSQVSIPFYLDDGEFLVEVQLREN